MAKLCGASPPFLARAVMLMELALSDGGGLYKWAGAILVLLVTVWWARKQSSATKRSSDPALACGDTFEEGVSFASVLDIPELRKLIERHHDGDREPADPATHDLEDTIQVCTAEPASFPKSARGGGATRQKHASWCAVATRPGAS